MSTITLWCVEYVGNNIGLWSADWFDTREAAHARMTELAARPGWRIFYEGDAQGEYGDILPVAAETVELTPQGVLKFARNHAVGYD